MGKSRLITGQHREETGTEIPDSFCHSCFPRRKGGVPQNGFPVTQMQVQWRVWALWRAPWPSVPLPPLHASHGFRPAKQAR